MSETTRNQRATIGVRQYRKLQGKDNYGKVIETHTAPQQCRKLEEIERHSQESDNIGSYRKETTIAKTFENKEVSDNVGNYKKSKGNHTCPTLLKAIGKRQLQESHQTKIQVSDNVGNYKKSKGNHVCPTILEAIGNRELQESH